MARKPRTDNVTTNVDAEQEAPPVAAEEPEVRDESEAPPEDPLGYEAAEAVQAEPSPTAEQETTGGDANMATATASLDEAPIADVHRMWTSAVAEAEHARDVLASADAEVRKLEDALCNRVIKIGKGVHVTIGGRRFKVKRRPEKHGGGLRLVADDVKESLSLDD